MAVLVVSLLGLAAIGGPTTPSTPAGAAGTARNGLTAATAAPSCWSIKQSYAPSTDGIYWLWTPKLVEPQQFYCDMTTDGGGWVLIGRGREGWSFPYWGQGSPSTVRNPVTGTAAFAPASLPTPTVVGLMNGGRMDGLTDGIRLRRATNVAGTSWQEVRMRVKSFGTWSWAFGGGIPLSSITFDATTTSLSTSFYQTNTTSNVQVGNDARRVTTYPLAAHNQRAGFSFGSGVTGGSSAATSYLWEFANENSGIPFTQVFIRPTTTDADIAAGGVTHAPDSGIAASTVRKMLDRTPVSQGWAVTGLNVGVAVPNIHDYVKTIAQIGNTIYLGGKFLRVQHGIGGPTFTQSYLAAFDVNTGEWIPSFNPAINAPVWKIAASPDGTKLFVGGEFTNVNGVANTTALAALDPATGTPVPATTWLAYASRPSGTYDVRAMSIQGQWLYLGGNFTTISGGTGSNFVGPLTLSRLSRVRLSDGRPDWNWVPTLETAPMDINASSQGDRVYMVGTFSVLNGVTLNPTHQAVIDTTTGAAVHGLKPWIPSSAAATDPSNAILEVGDHVYQGGSQHYLQSYARSDYSFERGFITQNTGGDYQALASKDGILYGSCHCVTDYQYEDTTSFPTPQGYTRVDPINLIGAYDMTNNLEAVPEFHPTQLTTSGDGPWALFFDSNGCMWAGGDLIRQGASASAYYGGYEKFCDRDTTAPTTPTNSHATLNGNDVTLTWNASTDNAATPIHYEILKDDPTFGTIVIGTTFDRTLTDSNVVSSSRYFIRAVDEQGNRSATTAVLTVTPPPPAAATLLAHGATWSYRADGQDLGSAWRQTGFNSSSWATGPSQLGWGGKGETTVIPSGAVTSYYVRHQNITNPGQYKTITIRLKRDDGAVVYVNGIPVVSDNMPDGPLTAATLASSFTSGASETTWFEHQLPATLFKSGDNTIAVEVHQAAANNADSIFDLELVARNSSETTAPTTPHPSLDDVDFSSAAFSWAPSTDNAEVIGYIVRRNGTPIAFTEGTSFAETGLSASTSYTYQVTAIDSSGNASASGSLVVSTTANNVLAQSGAMWSYRATNADQGTAWRQPGFDASAWPSGRSQLGWGNRGETTTVPTGTMTQYYRRHVNVVNAATVGQLTLRFKRDDGIAVYVNGTEVARDNLPAGTLTAATPASSTVTAADGIAWKTLTIPSGALVTGDNVIAAEVHQRSTSDSRGVFDLELLTGTTDITAPTTSMTFPANNARYNSAGWTAGCSATTDLCGTASDHGSGLASVRMTIQRSNNHQYWTGSAWQAGAATITATGTTAWNVTLPRTKLANGVTYTVTVWSLDHAGLTSPSVVRTFTYDTVGPTSTAANLVTANKNGAINANRDTFTVTFNEALRPSSVPATATLTLSRSNGVTSYGISKLTNGLRSTGGTGYLGSATKTRTVTFTGTLVLSNANKTVTFKVTGACAGTCGARIATKQSGAFRFVPATTLRDVAGNAPSTASITAASTVMF